MREDLSFEVTEHIATLGQNPAGTYTIELNRVSFGGGTAKLEVRRWHKESNTPLKGIALKDAEAEALRDALTEYFDRKDS